MAIATSDDSPEHDGVPLSSRVDSHTTGRGLSPDGTHPDDSHAADLLGLVAVWEDAYARGIDLPAESLCREHPDLLPLASARIDAQKRLRAFLGMDGLGGSDAAPGGDLDPLPSFPGFETISEIGRGGMGVVYKAQDSRLGRVVAIKTITEDGVLGLAQAERFLVEARAVARLRHPHIIPIHAIGEHDGRPYFTMELAAGGDLAQRLSESLLAPAAAAKLVLDLATAVQYAHERGVIHRDIKPRNVLLTAEGVPQLSDFGLARLRDADSSLTASGQPLGTPSYMAPELARGDARQAGPAADVYALGTILYQALVGRPPFLGDSTLETLRLVVTTDVDPPRRLRREVPRDLETITLKCLEKEPARRYASAADLARDLGRLLEGRPIAARRASLHERSIRWCRRNPWIATAGALLVLGTAVSTWQAARATSAQRAATLAGDSLRRERDRAEAERTRAQLSSNNALRAIQNLLGSDGIPVATEEIRRYRGRLLASAIELLTEQVKQLEGDPKGGSLRVGALMALATVQHESARYKDARAAAEKAVTLAEELVKAEPASTLLNRDLASVYQVLAQVLAPFDREASHRALLRSVAVWEEKLIAGHEDDPDLLKFQAMNQYNLALTHFYLGAADGARRGPETEAALAALERASGAIEAALRVAKDRDPLLIEAARIHNLMVPINGGLNRVETAIEMGRKAIREYRELSERRPDDHSVADMHFGAQRELGYLFITLERCDEAVASNRAARETQRERLRRFEGSASLRVAMLTDLAVIDNNLIDACSIDAPRHLDEIRELCAEAVDLCEKLLLVVPRSVDVKYIAATRLYLHEYYRELDGQPPDLAALSRAERLLDELLAEAPNHQADESSRCIRAIVRLRIADILSDQGRHGEASKVRDRAVEGMEHRPEIEYLVASSFAGDARIEAESPTRLDRGSAEKLRDRSVRHAVETLDRAIGDGFRDVRRFETDRAFAQVRTRREFAGVANRLRDSTFPDNPFASR